MLLDQLLSTLKPSDNGTLRGHNYGKRYAVLGLSLATVVALTSCMPSRVAKADEPGNETNASETVVYDAGADNAAGDHNSTGLEEEIEATPTEEPTPELTVHVPPTATSTPQSNPDPLGLRANKFVPVTDASQVQDIVDYFQEHLMGRKLIGTGVPIKISSEDEFTKAAKIYVPKLDPKRQFAFGAWNNIIDGQVIGYKIYIRSGRPLWEVVRYLCNESAKAHSITSNPNILGNNYSDNLVNEASSLPFERACILTLEQLGYDAFSIAKTRSNETYISNTLLPFYLVPKGDRFDGVLAIPWVAARELGLLDALLERPNKRLSIDEELKLFEHINSKSPAYWREKLNADPPEFETIRQISIARLTPGIRDDTGSYSIIFPIGLISFYAP